MYERTTAATPDDFVVFLLGLKINRWRAVRHWRPVVAEMPRMLAELRAHPELGLLKAYPALMFGGPATIQYWRSYDLLDAYARSARSEHLPAWRRFNRLARDAEAVGIWHETYRIGRGQWETIYGAMPAVGLRGAVGGHVLDHGSTARTRIGDRAVAPALVDPVPVDASGRDNDPKRDG